MGEAPHRSDGQRRRALAVALTQVRGRIDDAAHAAGRNPAEVTLIAVTKGFPSSDIEHLQAVGVRDVGENRDQEARVKVAECADLAASGLTWHMIGQVQRRKAASVARWADVVQSVDRIALADALALAREPTGAPLDVLIQVDVEARTPTGATAVSAGARGGVATADVAALADRICQHGTLRLRGVMAVLPLGEEPVRALAAVAVVSSQVRTIVPAASWISAGMSGDFEQAVAMGATHVRIGSALLGQRGPLR